MRKKSPPVTPEIVKKVKELLKQDHNQHDIAAMIGFNQGRVSETKHGKYDHLLQA